VSMGIPAPATGWDDPSTWIKSLDNPTLSMQVAIDSWPEFVWAADDDLQSLPEGGYFGGSYTGLQGIKTTGTFLVQGAERADAFLTLLKSKLVLLQTSPMFNRPSIFAVVGSVKRADVGRMEQQYYSFTVELTQVERPTTVDAPSRMPTRSFADRMARYPTFNAVPAITFEQGMEVT
jgi:hypothetical protein